MASQTPASTISSRAARGTPLIIAALVLAGCSSDVTRFDYPSFGLTESNPRSVPATRALRPMQDVQADAYPVTPYQQSTQGYAQPAMDPGYMPPSNAAYQNNYNRPSVAGSYQSGPIYRPYSGPAYGAQGPAAGTACGANPCEEFRSGAVAVPQAPRRVQTARLEQTIRPLPPGAPVQADVEPAGEAYADAVDPVPMAEPMVPARQPTPYVPPAKLKKVAKEGTRITVGEGETLYRIARDYGVSVSALMSANKLPTPSVKPGMTLFIPGDRGARALREWRKPKPQAQPVQEPQIATEPVAPVQAKPSQPLVTPETVDGDGLAAMEPAATVAGPTYTVRAGDSFYGIARTLGVSADALAAENGITDPARIKQGQVLRIPAGKASPAADAAQPATVPAAMSKPPVKLASTQPMAPSAEEKLADTTEKQAEGRRLYRWPVRGRVIAKFNRNGSPPNEGIDLAVPMGTDVHAAEDGTVAYAGDELEGYGKIILIRHEGGWVTAYAHNDQLLVSRNAKVKRGQVIAKSGKTGKVAQPMLHFELRKGTDPVDPLPYLSTN